MKLFVIRSPIRVAAAWLAHQARLSNRGQLPSTDQLLRWWIKASLPQPDSADRFAGYIYELINFGIEMDKESGLRPMQNRWTIGREHRLRRPVRVTMLGVTTGIGSSMLNYSRDSRTLTMSFCIR